MQITENKINPENVVEEQPKPVATYDPNKNYNWQPNSIFMFTGEEFGLMLNSLRSILNTPEARRVLVADKASQALESALARAVEMGMAKEIEDKRKQ
jgi:hypothetical protein